MASALTSKTNLSARKKVSMSDPAIEYEVLDAGAQIGDRGATGTITLLTRGGRVTISMKRPVMEQLCHHIERELHANPIPITDLHREIS